MKQSPVEIVPITLPTANLFIVRWHRHHAPAPPGLPWFCLGAVVEREIRGVAIGGRPSNRNNDDKQTIEVLRLASDGTPNVPSALLGACGRVGRAMGASRVITYTLEEESGSSLKAAGWTREKDGIQSAWTMGQTRTLAIERDHMAKLKVRWALNIRPLVEYDPPMTVEENGQSALPFGDHPVIRGP